MTFRAPDGTSITTLRALVDSVPEGTFVVAVEGDARSVELDGSAPTSLLVGNSSACDLRLSDPSVSRRHCSFEVVGARLRVIDLGSTNGTWVDHVQVREALLSGGETVRVGDVRLRITRRADGRNAPVPPGSRFGRMLGESRAMRRLYPLCARLAQVQIPVIIEGETGTGKEVLAEALHEEGPRREGPFVVFDCTTVAPNLIESELFGHEKGSFTGASGLRRGVFEQAHGGTLFLDELGDLPLELQAKLLRVLERAEVRRVGGDRWVRCDVRIVAATRRDLDGEVQKGRFRDDLFHRLAVGRIALPPLRERVGDVVPLARHFWTQVGGVGAPPAHLLARWSEERWPGNVRELRNAVSRAVALGAALDVVAGDGDEPAEDSEQPAADLSSALFEQLASSGLPLAEARQRVIDEFERHYLTRLLEQHGGNVTRAAAATGVARRHLQRLRAKSRS